MINKWVSNDFEREPLESAEIRITCTTTVFRFRENRSPLRGSRFLFRAFTTTFVGNCYPCACFRKLGEIPRGRKKKYIYICPRDILVLRCNKFSTWKLRIRIMWKNINCRAHHMFGDFKARRGVVAHGYQRRRCVGRRIADLHRTQRHR